MPLPALLAIAEPMTTFTDFALAALGFYWGGKLLAGRGRRVRAVRAWGLAFLALALGALLGGVTHGFGPGLGETARTGLWKATVFSIGAVSYWALTGMARTLLAGAAWKLVRAAALVKLLAYWAWMAGHDEFRYVILDYAPSLLLAAVAGLWLWRRRGRPAGAWIAAGVLVSFAGAGVQLSGFALHPQLNHNDLYHVIQMAGLYLLYRGAEGLEDDTIEG
ncbi:MAG: hypothetical protein GC160_24215 [Acidobacteria bacterium]|nr:hypothetical protein [Acidobacteriota bacterium]